MDIYLKILRIEEEATSLKDVLLGFDEFLQAPIAIIDKDYRILAYHYDDENSCDSLFRDNIISGYWNLEIIKKVTAIFLNFKEQNSFITKLNQRKRLFLCVRDGENEILGYIAILENEKKLEDINAEVIYHLSKCVKRYLLHPEYEKETASSYFSYLLNHEIKEKEVLQQKAKELDIPLNKRYSLFIFALAKSKKHSLEEIKKELLAFFHNPIFLQKGDQLLLLYQNEIDEERLNAYLFEYKIYALQSMKINSLGLLKNVYKINDRLLTYLIKKKDEYVLFKEADYAYLLPVLEVDSLEDLFNMIDEKVMKILSYDIENEADFLLTLYIYLKNDKSLNEASRQLYVHKNTITYRLKKMEEIAQISFEDCQSNLNILTSLFIAMYLKDCDYDFSSLNVKTNKNL